MTTATAFLILIWGVAVLCALSVILALCGLVMAYIYVRDRARAHREHRSVNGAGL